MQNPKPTKDLKKNELVGIFIPELDRIPKTIEPRIEPNLPIPIEIPMPVVRVSTGYTRENARSKKNKIVFLRP